METNKGQKMFASHDETELRSKFTTTFRECPIPGDEITQNLGLFADSKLWARLLFLRHLYLLQLTTHGVIMDFGTRWGQNMAVFASLRGIYEPYNRFRRIIGFDTFAGFPSVSPQDGNDPSIKVGGYTVTEGYEKYLDAVMAYHEQSNPMGHIKRYELVKGDVTETLPTYLENHPETLISLVYCDMDLHQPTRECLRLLRPYLQPGAIIGFDELCEPVNPGETIAFREIFGGKVHVERLPITSRASYVVWNGDERS